MTIGVVAPSSPILEASQLNRAVAFVEELGFRVVLGEHVRDVYGYLAGRDRDRAEDLLAMLERDDVDAIICLRGGMGGLRTALALDRERLRRLRGRTPKAFVGFSDITVQQAVLLKDLDWVTFYGPVLIHMGRLTPYTMESFQQALMSAEPFDVLPDPDDPYLETIVPGVVEAELVGGCLQLLALLIGTPWEFDLRGKIFFFEDTRFEPWEIDQMISQHLAAGTLQECAGIVIGEHARVEARDSSMGLEQVFDDLIRPLGIPTLYRLPIGHGKHHATVPIGVRARLDATNKTLRILESGVV